MDPLIIIAVPNICWLKPDAVCPCTGSHRRGSGRVAE